MENEPKERCEAQKSFVGLLNFQHRRNNKDDGNNGTRDDVKAWKRSN